MKEVILDTETTGLFVKDGHRIVEIGCIELEDLVPTKNRFHCYLNPERKVSEKALEVHGYTDEFLSKQKKFSDVVDNFLNFIENKRLVIHNAEFDLSHLNNELALLGKEKLDNKNVLALLGISIFSGVGSATPMQPNKGCSLPEELERVGW
jgi:DNA polymerase-3 subunit epsilon